MKNKAPLLLTVTLNPSVDRVFTSGPVTLEDPMRLEHAGMRAGGKGINVSRVYGKLGAGTLALFPYGGPNGTRLVSLLQEEGIPAAAFQISGETRENWTVMPQESPEYLKLNTAGPALSGAESQSLLHFTETVLKKHEGCAVLLTGSAPAGCGAAFFEVLCALFRRYAGWCYLDADRAVYENLPPGFVWDAIKPNRAEALRITRSEAVSDEQLFCLLEERARAVFLTDGPRGAICRDEAGGLVTVKPQKLLAKAPPGMGDAYYARLIFGGLSLGLMGEKLAEFAGNIDYF